MVKVISREEGGEGRFQSSFFLGIVCCRGKKPSFPSSNIKIQAQGCKSKKMRIHLDAEEKEIFPSVPSVD